MTSMHDNGSILHKDVEVRIDPMKYLPEELKKEYEREASAIDDLEGISPPLVNVSDILRAYFILADYFSDPSSEQDVEPMLIGVKNRNLLASAVGRQIVSFGGHTKYTRDLDICATLFYGLVKNHAFHDGNKRVSLLILLYQLIGYGFYPTVAKKDFEKLVLAVAANKLKDEYWDVWKKFDKSDDCIIKTLAFQLKKMVIKKDHSYHITITMREFCEALKGYGVICQRENGKMHMTKITRGLFGNKKEVNHSIPFGGWTRVLGAQTARETLQVFGIYDQHPTYQSVMEKRDPMYKLVAEFEQPLRRLKDE